MMKLRNVLPGPFAAPLAAMALAVALGLAAPLAAQSEITSDPADSSSGEMSGEDMVALSQMFGGMFQAQALTAEEEARLPLANDVVAKLLPAGLYGQLMEDMMGSTMKPILSMFSGPQFVVMNNVTLDEGMPDLSQEELAELAVTLDPGYATRTDTMISAMTAGMGEMFGAMEQPMREGLARAYVTRFTADQLGEINAFFSTPTGALYARESMAMAADPQFMSSIMGSMPQMMDQVGDMDARMEAAMADVPEARSFANLSAAERSRVAGLLGVSVAELQAAMERAKQNASMMDDPAEADEAEVDDDQ